jgi:iron(II)-dependent oxidoreductase
MYEQCATAGRCTRPPTGSFAPEKRPNFPVGAVTWEQAWSFCDWAGKRLPTEAEFEKASRGVDGRVFPWGSQEPDCSRLNNYACGAFVRPVGSYSGGDSPYGAKDLSGNVWEWVSDWYEQDYYSITPDRDPLGPSSGPVRVRRGGGSIVLRIPTHYRRGDSDIVTAMPFAGLGFRCVRSLPHDEAADAAPAGTRAGVPAAETREGWKALRAYERAAAISKQKDPLPARALLEARSYATECWSQGNRVRDLIGGGAAGKPLYDPGKEMFKTADGSMSLAAMLDRCIELSRELGQRKGEGCGVKRVTIARVKDGLKDFSDPRVYADAAFTEKDCRLMPKQAPGQLPEPLKRVAPELEKLCGASAVFVFGDDGVVSEQRIYLVSRLLQSRVNGSCWQRGTLDFAPTAWPLPGL